MTSSTLSSGGRLRADVTDSEGDVLDVTAAALGTFSATDYDTLYYAADGGVDYEDCPSTSTSSFGGAFLPFCGDVSTLTDAETGSTTWTENYSETTIKDACGNVVSQIVVNGWHIVGTDYMQAGWIGGEPVTLPTSGFCFGEWTVTYLYSQTFHDNQTLEASASLSFSVTGTEEVAKTGQVTPDDLDLSTTCPCSTPVVQAAGVAPGTGDVVENFADLTLPGAGIPLSLSRGYDSGLAQAQVTAGLSPGPLGYGWAYNLGMSLSLNTSTEVATVSQENGTLLNFSPYVSGTSPSWCSGATNYCVDQSQDLVTLEHNGPGTWTMVRYTDGNPMTFGFSSTGALVSETNEAGSSLTASSESAGSGACPSTASTCTVWTSSSSGRLMTLAFDSSARLSSATDGSGNTVSYCYYGQSCAGGASGGGAHDLYSATSPGGAVTSYAYDYSNSTAAFDHDLLSEALPSGGTVTNTYNSSGELSSQDDPSADLTLTYSGSDQSLAGGSTVISDWPTGTSGPLPAEETEYSFSSGLLVSETTGYGTSSASTTYYTIDPASLVSTQVQDGDDNISLNTLTSTASPMNVGDVTLSSDGMGNVTQYAYNADNQIWCEVGPAEYSDGVTCPSSAPSSPPSPGASDPYPGATISFYNSAGELTAQTDPLGNTTTYSYTSGVSGVPNGLQYCSVDPVDYQKSVTCPAYGASHLTGTTTETYDSAGDLTSSTDALGNTTSYTYDVSGHPGLVSSETSPDGTTTTYTYNSGGQVTQQVETFGSYSATTRYAYNSAGEQYCSVAPLEVANGATCPSSPPSSPPTPGHDSYLGATITTFNTAGQPVQVTNPLGGISYTAYDEAGNVYCTVAPAEAATGVTCPSSPPSSPPTTGDGATITSYDTFGRPVQVTNPLGGITLYQYDADNNVLTSTAESGATADPNVVVAYSYDGDDRVYSTTVDPSGGTAASTIAQFYDPDGNVYCSVSADAFAAGTSAYQCPAWLSSWISAPPSPTSLYSTSPTATQADNVTMSFYDADGEELQTTNPDVETTISAFDGDGRTYCSSDPTNVANWLTANESGAYPYLCPSSPPSSAPAQGSNPGYVTTIYDAAGNQLSSTDQVGDTTSYTYGPDGQVLTTTDPRGKVTTNCYYYENETGQCAASAPSGGGAGSDLYSTTTPATSTDPSGETTTYTYYPGDAPDVTTNPAGTATDAYDAAGDLASVTYGSVASGYSTPPNVSYTYNADQTRATMTDGTGTTTYSYDGMGDLTSEALSAASGSGLSNETTSYGYFTTGVLASVTYPAYRGYSSPEVSYDYDATGAMASETDWLGNTVSFAHDESGNETAQDNDVSSSKPSGTSSTSWAYDPAGYNTSATSTLAQSCGGGETLTQSFSGRNPDGQLTSDAESYTGSCSGQGSYQRAYSYDLAGRVVYQGSSAQGSSPNDFAYDPSGDPTTLSAHDAYGNFDTYTQAFDSAGEVTSQTPVTGSSGSTSSYTYDTLGDLRSTTSGGGSGAAYGFNSLGEMTSTSGSGATSTVTLTPGDLYTLAGSAEDAKGTSGDGGSPTSALLGEVGDVIADPSGNLYIADTSNNRVQEVAGTTHSQWGISMTAGDIYTIAGSSSGTSGSSATGTLATSALLSAPTSIALDSSGNLYVADSANNRVVVIAASTCTSCVLGQSTTIGYMYVVAGTGTAGHSGDNGPATSAHLDLPSGVALDSAGNLYIADQYNNRVQFVAVASCTSSCPWGLSSTTADDIYTVAGSSSGSEGASGNGTAMRSALLNGPDAVGLDPSGNLYIADTANNRVLIVPKVSCSSSSTCPFGLFSSMTADDIYTIAGSSSGTSGHSGDGSAATSALLGEPAGIALDPSGDLYIADTDNNRVQEVPAAGGAQWGETVAEGDIYTVAGSMNGTEGTSGLGGLASSALLSGVSGVGTDAVGDLFVADTYNYQVDEVPTLTATVGASYTYNGDGLEASRTSSGVLTQFTWGEMAGSSLPVIVSDGANDYVYGPSGEPVEQVSLATSAPTYLTYTPSDSSWLSTNEAGDETGFWRYDAFGTLALGTPTSPFGYSGQYTDASTGLVNDRARWYQVQTGEFTTRDPAFASTDTAYTYAGDEPVNEVDPNGMLLVGPGGAGTVAYFNCGQVSSGSEMSFSTARRSQCLFYSFVEHGYSEYAAAAVVGNIYVESSGIDSGGPLPNTTGDPMLAWQATGAGCGLTTNLSATQSAEEIAANCMNVGIAQWGLGPGYSSNPRVAGLIDYARQQGQPWWDFDTQVGYIFKELGSSSLMVNGYTGTEVASALKTCGTSLYNCTYDFMYGYEGPQANTAQLRTFYAQLALNAWRGVASYGLTCDLWAGWQHAAIVAGE